METVIPVASKAGMLPPAEVPTLSLGADRPAANRESSSAAPLEGRNFGDYQLIKEIARGGMGVVYKARQTKLNRIVALKMILAGQLASDHDVKRFYAEAEAAAALDHPCIVPIYEVGEHKGQHFFSMGFVNGVGLDAKLKDGPLLPQQAARLMQTIAKAIHYAHQKGVIHRDLKPGNVLIDGNGWPRVTDFGLAKQTKTDSGLTATGQVMGTPSYMPPEQAAGKTDQIDRRSDVYSLGAILYCLLTGRPPFQAANLMQTLKQVLERDPVPSAATQSRHRPRSGNNLPEVSAEGTVQTVSIGEGTGCRVEPLYQGRTDNGPADRLVGAQLALGEAKSTGYARHWITRLPCDCRPDRCHYANEAAIDSR